jgi:phosphoserine phosphatase
VTGEVKAQIVQEVKKNGGLAIMALTDSMQDAPLLEEAATVVAVFPERRLARLAKERGWRIVEG